ncbi:MAG TPA: MFS transporter, partial [Candidatus Elarobacter sp.]
AAAPSFTVLVAAHVVHGLVAGMLFIVILPPLLTAFGGAKLSATASVMVPALFGAATLGPPLGGLVAAPHLWRAIFAAEVVVAAIAYLMAPFVLERSDPPAAADPIDWYALTLAGAGSSFVYAGVGMLAGSDWHNPVALGSVAAGLACYAALIAGEAVKRKPLAPVRELAASVALVGAIATVVGSAAFSALVQGLQLTLLRVDGLSPREAGFAFWPEFLAAMASGLLFGRLVTTRWVVLCGSAGLVCLALAAALARALAPVTPAEVSWLSVAAGFGAGLCVSPGLFLIALSFERALVGRAVALLNLFRLTGGFISAPGVEHTIGSRAAAHLRELDPSIPPATADAAVRAFATGAPSTPAHVGVDLLRRALALGIADAYGIVTTLALAGTAAIVVLIVIGHIPLRAPDLKRFDEGKPALDPRPLAA